MPSKTTPAEKALTALQAERDTLAARRDELATSREEAASELADAQRDLVDGKAGATEAVTTAQARVSGADGALSMLAERLAEFDRQIEDAQHLAAIDAQRQTLRTSAAAAEAARGRYYDAIGEARQALVAAAEAAAAIEDEWLDASRAFVAAHGALRTGDEDPAAILKAAGLCDHAALYDGFHHVRVAGHRDSIPSRHSPRPDLGPATDTAFNAVSQTRQILARRPHAKAA